MANNRSNDSDGVFTRKDRKGFWISWKDAQGRRRYRRTDAEDLAQAKTVRAAELVRVEKAKVLGFTPPGEDLFAKVGERFLAHQKARLSPQSYERERGILEGHLNPFFSGRIASIRRVDVQRFITQRSGKLSPHSVQKELNVLKHFLRLAVDWEIIPLNPAQGIKSPKVPPGRVRYLQPTELHSVLEACPDWLRPIVALAVSTGMRRSEILGLRWLDVDMAHHRILLPQTKNNEGRAVYLNQSARAILRSLPFHGRTKTTDGLFPDVTPEKVSVAFKRACRKVQIADFRFHDLRHTAASWLRMTGADIHTVAQLLGHKDLRMAARYQHLSPAFLAEAVSRLESVFGDLCYPQVTKKKELVLAADVTT